ncbi:MAG: ATP-binding cassette domain-containing protein [Porphyromonadaceae bacterium]|nr:ATP-binding cassette domain-containing protein [Porphyromonadaceae bacterium]
MNSPKKQAPLLFSLDHACIGYPETPVLEGFSWQVARGEHWAIVGPNGAGKTTLVKTLLGLLPIRAGYLSYYDREGRPASAPSIGYLPQINRIDRAFPIDTYEVVSSGLQGTSLGRGEQERRIAELLEAIDLVEYTHTPIGRLSGGQLQRALLARALAARPELLVLDEPMSFLDRSYKDLFGGLLSSLAPKDSTILMVTHDLPNTIADEYDWQTLAIGRW